MVHGEQLAKEAEEASEALFNGGGNTDNMPYTEIEPDSTIIQAIVSAGFAESNGQAKKLVTQGGISLNDKKVTDISYKISDEELEKKLILKKGKKGFCKLIKR